MPASAGRVRMPHNNRMSTSASLKSSEIWSKTIKHDPYAGNEDADADKKPAASEEKVKSVMEMARTQNVTDGAKRDDFTAKMYLGLKRGKVRRQSAVTDESANPEFQQVLENASSSSEDEFVEEEDQVKEKVDKKVKKKKKSKRRKKYESSSSSSSDSSSSEEESRRRRKRERSRRRKKSDKKSSRDSDRDRSRDKRRKTKK